MKGSRGLTSVFDDLFLSVYRYLGFGLLFAIISKKVSNVCDPVFLLDKSYWMKYIEKYSTDIKQKND